MNRTVCFLILISICTSSFAFTAYPDIEYYPAGTAPQIEKNRLDIYVPDGAETNTPVIFFVHGGTWMFNDRTDFAPVGTELSDGENFVVVIPSYRLSDSLHPGNTHPCHIEDVAQAFAWTVNNISDYSGNPSRIIVMGHSAGGHLAVLLSTNTYYLESAGAEIEDIFGVINFSMGVYDIPKLYYDIGPFASMGYSMIGFDRVFGPIADSAAVWYDASPKYHLSSETPPTLHFVTMDDMEHIIGGDFGGFGLVFLPGEIQFVYDDYNANHPTDTFWIDGDHDTGFSTFVFNPFCRARSLTMAFIDDLITNAVTEAPLSKPDKSGITCHPNPFNSSCRLISIGADYFEIYDLRGSLVDRIETISGEAIWVPSENITSGVYLIKGYSGDYSVVTKLTFVR